MAKRDQWLQIRMHSEELARLDRLVLGFGLENRADLIRRWMIESEERLAKSSARRKKSEKVSG